MSKFIRMGLLIGLIELYLIPNPAAGDVKTSVKIFGGWTYVQAGDVNRGTEAFFDWGKSYLAPPAGGLIEGGYEPLHGGYELGGDVVIGITRKIGLGIGLGYLRSLSNPRGDPPMMLITDNPQGEGWLKYFHAATWMSAIPLRLGLFLAFPIGDKLSLTANAGASGYFNARYKARWWVGLDYTGATYWPAQFFETLVKKKAPGLGFQGGLGIEYALFRTASFFVEAQGRWARFSQFEGETHCMVAEEGVFPPFDESGTLYYESVPLVPNSPRLILVQSDPPDGPGGYPRQAVVDFSGVSLRAGVRVYF